MHQEKSVRCLLVYMPAMCKASLEVATMQRNTSGILSVTRNFIPDPLLQTPLYWILYEMQVWDLSGDNTLSVPITYIILCYLIDICWNIHLSLQYWLTDHILSSLFYKCSVLLGTRQHLSEVGAEGKHSSRLKKSLCPAAFYKRKPFWPVRHCFIKAPYPTNFQRLLHKRTHKFPIWRTKRLKNSFLEREILL